MVELVNVPTEWEQLTVARLRGTLLVIGATDVGKTIFARYLYQRLCSQSRRAAYLDGDPGQSTLGPPTVMTLAVGLRGDGSFPPRGGVWQSFVGAVSPRGHMLQVLVGASRLGRAAYDGGAEVLVYDTTGLVDAALGGLALKLAKVDLLRPTAVFALQRALELAPGNRVWETHYALAVNYSLLGQSDEAAANAQLALEMTPEERRAELETRLKDLGLAAEGE